MTVVVSTQNRPRGQVVVTGVGVVCAAGIGISAVWDRLRQSGPPAPSRFVAPPPTDDITFPVYVVPPYTLADVGIPERTRQWLESAELGGARDLHHAVAATALALRDAGLPLDCRAMTPGVASIAANESPGFESLSRSLFDLGGQEAPETPRALYDRLVRDFFQLNTFLPPHYLARAFGLAGPSLFVNSACASGLSAIDAAVQAIRLGRCTTAVVAASDNPLSAAKFYWFRDLGLLAADGCLRPFDARVGGTVFGDGGAALVLEDAETARARGARVYAEVVAAGFAQDGWKVTIPHPDRGAGETALRSALAEAGITAAEVDVVVPHGVGAAASDQYEARLLHAVFGGRDVWPRVTALKPCVGHSLGASAMMESALLLAAMQRESLPPVWGYEQPPKRHPLPLAREWQTRPFRIAVKLTCAFAGYHAAMVFRRESAA
jgi:3-oxoacyl-[acyl-carrier-protein] synthase II